MKNVDMMHAGQSVVHGCFGSGYVQNFDRTHETVEVRFVRPVEGRKDGERIWVPLSELLES